MNNLRAILIGVNQLFGLIKHSYAFTTLAAANYKHQAGYAAENDSPQSAPPASVSITV